MAGILAGMSTDRIPHLDWQPELGTDDIVGGLDDIDQCIRTILLTPKGSDPHNPPFGSNIHLYIDWPQNRVTPHLVREAVLAIRDWEPRIDDVQVKVSHALAAVELIVEWTPVGGGARRTTTVRFDK